MRTKLIFLAFAIVVTICLILLASNTLAQQAEIRRLRQRVENIEIVINQPENQEKAILGEIDEMPAFLLQE